MKIQCSSLYANNKSMFVCVGAFNFHYIWLCWYLVFKSKPTHFSTGENWMKVWSLQKFQPLDDYQNPHAQHKIVPKVNSLRLERVILLVISILDFNSPVILAIWIIAIQITSDFNLGFQFTSISLVSHQYSISYIHVRRYSKRWPPSIMCYIISALVSQ